MSVEFMFYPGVRVRELDGRPGIIECQNPEPRCPQDLSIVHAMGVSVVDALNNLRNWVDFYNSYDHCSDPLPEPDTIVTVDESSVPPVYPTGRFRAV